MTVHPTVHRFRTLVRRAVPGALALLIATAVAAAPQPAGAATPQPGLPQVTAAHAAANWLASKIVPGGYIPSSTSPTTPDLAATANVVLALAASGVDTAQATSALAYLAANVDTYVTVSGADGPGQLALLILDAHAMGVSPTAFGGTDLVSRLFATQRSTGVDAGLFGAQDPTYDGAYRQGLSLAALASAGVTTGTAVTAAETWLTGQQCPDGGWTSYVAASNPCNGKPVNYAGPDTNSSALAVQGLEAQHALAPRAATSAYRFLAHAQDADGGWGYEPNSGRAPGSTDPDSTALVLQALVSLGVSPTSAKFTKGSTDGVASLLSDQIGTGPGAGAIQYPGIPGPNMLATYQAAPALAGLTVAYDLGVPAVTKVAPSHGKIAGGARVKITGSGLVEATAVHFGARAATSVTVLSATSVVAVAPAGAAGVVAVTVTTPTGTSPTVAGDHYTYKG